MGSYGLIGIIILVICAILNCYRDYQSSYMIPKYQWIILILTIILAPIGLYLLI